MTGFAPLKGENRYKLDLNYAEKPEGGVAYLLAGL
jgi:hypothetical protein